MQIISKVQRDYLIYWAYSGANRYGEPTYAAPVQMKCRWDDCRKQVFMEDGSPVFTKIELITATALAVKGLVKKGRLTASIDQAVPKNNADVHEIVQAEITPMFTNRTVYLYEAYA
jgi:hypothetical protein